MDARSPVKLTPRLELRCDQGGKEQRRPTPSHLCGMPPSCHEDAQTTNPAPCPRSISPWTPRKNSEQLGTLQTQGAGNAVMDKKNDAALTQPISATWQPSGPFPFCLAGLAQDEQGHLVWQCEGSTAQRGMARKLLFVGWSGRWRTQHVNPCELVNSSFRSFRQGI